MRWTRMCLLTSGTEADGKGVWSWRPKGWRSSPSEAESFARATVAIGKVHRGERAISRKPSRREGRCDHRLYLWFLRLRSFFCARAPGAAATRPSLRPRLFEGDGPCKPRTRMRRENAK